ncbi:MAG: FkbM family methyltransferase [Planctomycetes bacterium]|nr:FkbM family methyltransferase [Planctomycetota bacterium]
MTIVAKALVRFFVFWKFKLGLKGAGLLLRLGAPYLKGLQKFPVRLDEGQIIYLDLRDYSGMGWLLFKEDSTLCEETGLVSAINSLSDNSSVIWDVGSNCGIVSYLIAKNAQFESLHFFEPNDFVYKVAVDALTPFRGVHGHNFALSNSNCELELTIPKNDTSCATLDACRTARKGVRKTITCRVGDQLIESKEVPAPNIIKIDVEGHELDVLNGLSKCIEAHSPVIFFEHISLTDTEIADAVPRGYEIFTLSKDRGDLKKGFDRSYGHNSAFIPSRRRRG